MRLHFGNMTRPRLVAKALRKAIAANDRSRPLAECQEIAARMFGYASWHELGKLHNAGPVSVDDAYAPSQVAYRRQHYGNVLRKEGIPEDRIAAIIATVRPSDRTMGLPIPEGFPRLLVEAFETDDDGNRLRALGMQDLTKPVVEWMLPYRASGLLRAFPDNPTVSSLSDGLSEEARRVGFDGRLALPGLAAAVEAFIAQVGGAEAVRKFKERLNEIRHQSYAIERAQTELERVRKASFSNDFSGLEFVFLSHGDEYLADFGDAYNSWGWDDYIARHPRPQFIYDKDGPGFGGPEYEAWNTAYAAFVRETAPSFVYATTPDVWGGVNAGGIRASIEDDEAFDADDHLSNEMCEHYEDAYSDIVDPDELQEIVERWMKNRADAVFDREIASWNAKQSITSYFPNYAVILPAFPGKTKADAVAWCEADIAAQKRKFAELHVWEVQAETPEPSAVI